jgi:hypothetical protein
VLLLLILMSHLVEALNVLQVCAHVLLGVLLLHSSPAHHLVAALSLPGCPASTAACWESCPAAAAAAAAWAGSCACRDWSAAAAAAAAGTLPACKTQKMAPAMHGVLWCLRQYQHHLLQHHNQQQQQLHQRAPYQLGCVVPPALLALETYGQAAAAAAAAVMVPVTGAGGCRDPH